MKMTGLANEKEKSRGEKGDADLLGVALSLEGGNGPSRKTGCAGKDKENAQVAENVG